MIAYARAFAACLVFIPAATVWAAAPAAEVDALNALYKNTAGASWTDNTNWGTGDPCTNAWFGVTCDAGNTTVETILLNNNNLVGTLPAGLQDLTNLKFLYLYDNQISGSIPSELANLSALLDLYLNDNLLTGSIPAALGKMSALRGLHLHNNNLTGAIPDNLGNLPALVTLYLFNNLLEGSIPAALGNISSLSALQIDSNNLTGSIPPELGNLTSLIRLYLRDNQLEGPVPSELSALTSLQYLTLDANKLTGELPGALTSLTGLVDSGGINLRYNGLYTDDAALDAFLDGKQGSDWSAYQTVAPENLQVTDATLTSVDLSWDLIEYTDDAGRYRVWYGTSASGPYDTDGGATADKTVNSITVDGLQAGTTYYMVVRTESDAWLLNSNQVISEDSEEVMVTPSGSALGEVTIFVPIDPCRVLDTRNVGGVFGDETIRDYRAWGDGLDAQGGAFDCDVPLTATSVQLNFTAINPGGFGYLRAWPYDLTEPTATLMAYDTGVSVSNSVALPICVGCPFDFSVKLYGATTHLAVEVVGYYHPPSIP